MTTNKFIGIYTMNLHEQCLLRYLTHPDELSYSTEILKLYNKILEQKFIVKNVLANITRLNYTKEVEEEGVTLKSAYL